MFLSSFSLFLVPFHCFHWNRLECRQQLKGISGDSMFIHILFPQKRKEIKVSNVWCCLRYMRFTYKLWKWFESVENLLMPLSVQGFQKHVYVCIWEICQFKTYASLLNHQNVTSVPFPVCYTIYTINSLEFPLSNISIILFSEKCSRSMYPIYLLYFQCDWIWMCKIYVIFDHMSDSNWLAHIKTREKATKERK